MIDYFINLDHTIQAFIATIFTWSVTMLGAALVFFFKKIKKSIMDAMLGFAAGVMIAASFWSLLNPAIIMAENLHMTAWFIVFIGFFSGGVLLFLGDKIFDIYTRKQSNNNSSSFKRCLMLVFSITLHNIPEGLAVGVAFGSLKYGIDGATISATCLLALGIGLQNFS